MPAAPPRVAPAAEPPRAAAADLLGPTSAAAEERDAFGTEPPFRPRRNPARMWTMIAIIAALLMLAATAAVIWFGVPRFGGTFAMIDSGTPLRIEDQRAEREALGSGNELLTVTGRIVNPTEKVQPVPQIRAEMQDAAGHSVRTWAISSPVPELQPHQSVTFNSSEVNLPKDAKRVHLDFGKTL